MYSFLFYILYDIFKWNIILINFEFSLPRYTYFQKELHIREIILHCSFKKDIQYFNILFQTLKNVFIYIIAKIMFIYVLYLENPTAENYKFIYIFLKMHLYVKFYKNMFLRNCYLYFLHRSFFEFLYAE